MDLFTLHSFVTHCEASNISAMVDEPLPSFSSSVGLSKFPNALLDDSVRKESENIFETRWGLSIGNDMRMHVREMSSLRIINGETMSESEKNDNKDIFKMLTMTKTGTTMFRVLFLFYHIKTKDASRRYNQMLKETFAVHLNYIRQMHIACNELLHSNTKRNLHLTCVVYGELLYFSQLWYKFVRSNDDYKLLGY